MTNLTPLRSLLAKHHLDALLITDVVNVSYLSGFTGDDTYLLITPNRAFLITDFRYIEQAEQETKGFRIIRHKKGLIDKTVEIVKTQRIKRLGFESEALSFAVVKAFSKKLPPRCRFKPTSGLVASLRAIKSGEEIRRIREAIICARNGFFDIRRLLKPGIRECDIAAELEYRMKKSGASRSAFGTIVAADKRASLPHARATDKPLTRPGLLQFDWGACLNSYNSDISRVVFLGKPTSFWQKIYGIVQEAQQRAINTVRAGVPTVEVDKAARGFIASKGYGPNFGHGLGHGVGREVHELPRIRRATNSASPIPHSALLQTGMVFTIEPGIYLPGKGGIRIEDMVLVTPTGCEVLTSSIPKAIDRIII